MIYYKISLISSPLNPLTYHSKEDIKDGTIVNIALNNRETKGVVISTCQEPNFKTNEIVAIGESYFSKEQIELAFFISSYYICSLGDAFALMVPFLAQVKTWVPMEFNDSLQPRLQPGQTGHESKLT